MNICQRFIKPALIRNRSDVKTHFKGVSMRLTHMQTLRHAEMNLLIETKLDAPSCKGLGIGGGGKSIAPPPDKIHFHFCRQESFALLLRVVKLTKLNN